MLFSVMFSLAIRGLLQGFVEFFQASGNPSVGPMFFLAVLGGRTIDLHMIKDCHRLSFEDQFRDLQFPGKFSNKKKYVFSFPTSSGKAWFSS